MNDLLIRFDMASEKDRIALMRDVMRDEAMAQECMRLALDHRRRALAELSFNGTTGYDDFCRLREERLITLDGYYRSRHPNAPPEFDLIEIHVLPEGMDLLTDETGAFDFFGLYVGAYIARSRRDGIVACRNAMESAIAIADTPFLRLVRSPETGTGARQAWGDQWNDLVDRTPTDIEAARKADHLEYDPFGPEGTVLHDLSGLPGANVDNWDKGLKLIDLPKWFAVDFTDLNENPREMKRREQKWAKLPDWDIW